MQKKLLIILAVAVVAGAVWYLWFRPGGSGDGKNYIGNSVQECARIQVLCIDGFERFDDARGCGCRPITR